MNNSKLSIVANSLSQYPEIKLIYINESTIDGINNIMCNVIYKGNSITEDRSKFIGIIANLEMARQLIQVENITFDYSIKTYKAFRKELNDPEYDTSNEFENGKIIYTTIKNKNTKFRK